ncbi:MAG: sulfite exporter TauE/SafE family protein [Alphaproteobacteria bacterium]|nr:sulfite exporter TauE/SafE family protein [Alphaproteobacteria bacterium]MBU0864616.1 sulfite exporter TauE/SafE family protein [Alphaproteobacteria bacterium]MBU1825827.1 sulfite exporter TauE/SafE family protein [Alphaproteobacteria bacterium]
MIDFAAIDITALLPFILIGFAAQLVDGALGMAFGVICNTLLVAVLGVPPATASARIHVVEIFTTGASGLSHLFHGNIDWPLFFRLLVPGVIGGILGAYVLTSLHADVVKPFVLGYLVLIGIWLLVRGVLYPPKISKPKVVAPLAVVGGFLDAAGGGGWGPVVTSNLLVQGGEPRKIVGTVNSVEFFLAVAVSIAFIANLGFEEILGPTLGLIIGGVAAAPLGAYMAKRFSPKVMLVMVGVVLTATSAFGLYRALI